MKFVIKGLNYTRIETDRTVQFWMLKKNRKPSDCGVWIDGIKTNDFSTMEKKRAKP